MEARTFEAKFNGPCAASCGEQIEVGDEARWASDGQRERVIHAGCDLIVEKRLQAGSVCPRCFTEKSVSGACACDE